MIEEIELLKGGRNHHSCLDTVRKITIDNINLKEDIAGLVVPNYFKCEVRYGGMHVKKNYAGEFFFEANDNGLLLTYQVSFGPKLFGANWLFKINFSFTNANKGANMGERL